MNRPSDTYRIPLPDDAKAHAGSSTTFDTQVGTPNDLIAFYDNYLRTAGWTLVTRLSHEPAASEVFYKRVYCRAGASAPDNVTVVVRPIAGSDQTALSKLGAQIDLSGGQESLNTCP